MTSKSRLSHRLELCELIKQLDEDECVNVIRSVYKELGCSSLNILLIKMILHLTDDVTSYSLTKMKKKINDISCSENTHIENTNEKPEKQEKQEKQENLKNSELHRLPIDLIYKISFYLNEKDIFNFEQCCILFYHIVNNLLYINQSNTFKTFDLTTQRLYQMTQKQHNFYKYSKATNLIIQNEKQSLIGKQEPAESQFETAKVVSGYDKWLTSMFKSIKSLKIERDGTVLLAKLPIDILFDADKTKSNLEILTVYGHNVNGEHEANVDKFYEKYIILKKEFENQGKKIRVLKCSQQSVDNLSTNVWSKFFCIESKHTCVSAYGSSRLKHLLEHNLQVCTGDNNSSLEILTLMGCRFDRIDTSMIKSNANCNGQMQIKTLRLIDLNSYSNTDILENAKLIESLNFHNSVKNLTLSCTIYDTDADRNIWRNVLSNLLTKKDYVNLDNVNILFHFFGVDTKTDTLSWIFEILNHNREILKHQFKQLNIGLRIAVSLRNQRYYILKWHCAIDEKFLLDYQQQCNMYVHDKQFDPSAKGKEKYSLIMQQWVA